MQNVVTQIYVNNPTPKDRPHRVHPAVSTLAWEFREASLQGRAPKYDAITVRQIEKRIRAVGTDHPTWPLVLRAMNMATKAEENIQYAWWLKAEEGTAETDNGDDDEEEDMEYEEGGGDDDDDDDDSNNFEEEQEEQVVAEGAAEEVEVGGTGKHKYISLFLRILMQCRCCPTMLEPEDKRAGSSTS